MNMAAITIVFFIGFVLAIILSEKIKVNAGFVAIGFGFLLTWITGGTTKAYIGAFPITMFWNYGIPVIFYGFATANGTLQKLAHNIAYKFKDMTWAMPVAIWLISAVVGATGAGTSATIMLAPIAWSLAIQSGMNYALVPLALWCGSMIGSFLPWTSTGSLNIAAWGQFLTEIDGMGMWWKDYTYKAFIGIVPFVIALFIFGGFKKSAAKEMKMDKPEPFTKDQKITMSVIFLMIALVVCPALIQIFYKNNACKWMLANLTVPATAAIGISILAIAKVGDIKSVFKNNVAWNLLFTITGMAMYCTLATSLGIVKYVGSLMEGMPGNLVLAALCLLGGGLSFVCSAATVGPMLTAMVPALAIATGLPQATVCLASCMGSGVTSISPYSTGGASALIGCPEEAASKMTKIQFACAIIFWVFMTLVCLTGLVKLI